MKKSKFFILTGAVTLAIISFYGRKPYATAPDIYAGSTYGTLFSSANSGSSLVLTTVNPNGGTTAGATAFFRTKNNSNWVTLQTTGASHTKLYFHS
jgi:hypothetical protein